MSSVNRTFQHLFSSVFSNLPCKSHIYETMSWPLHTGSELYPINAITTKAVNLINDENFDPSFIDINPSSTLPTLTADGKSYRSTTDIIFYLATNSPKALSAPVSHKSTIQQVHRDQHDPNFALLLVRDDAGLVAVAGASLHTFVGNHGEIPLPLSSCTEPSCLRKASQDPANSRHATLYAEKLAENEALLDIYMGPLRFTLSPRNILSTLNSLYHSPFRPPR
ncbi:hypothetical protein IW261DRAFT_1609403 [Armillaria novae-zelandiae]|uniref:GST N-terminal domain-containing protein n=1 Tax=Armillaria novae-zelandiae TaxID=153914 RepID=A0AA39P3M5_9AGAR|nr:hypothetical protein IW261DRAFT_1609403 [Armillaria novae-zelandiae]